MRQGPPIKTRSPAGAPWSELGPLIRSQWAPLEIMGLLGAPFSKCTCLEKSWLRLRVCATNFLKYEMTRY